MATATDTMDTPALVQRRQRSSFHLVMAVVMIAVALTGFGYEAPDYLIHPTVTRPAIMWVHGAAMFAWLMVYLAQTALIRADNVRAHRQLGQAALVLAALLIPLMLAASWVMGRFDLAHFPLPDRNGQIAFVSAQIWGTLEFATLVVCGARLRRQPEFHRRLMFMAMCGLLDAAFSRFPVPWGPVGAQLPAQWTYLAVDMMIVPALLRDRWTIGHVHRVFRVALPAILIGQATAVYLFMVHPQWWVATASKLLGIA